MPHRPLPFSGKAKKAQLKSRRERHRSQPAQQAQGTEEENVEVKTLSGPVLVARSHQPATEFVLPARSQGAAAAALSTRAASSRGAAGGGRPQRDLRTIFRKETEAEVARGRADSTRPLAYTSDDTVERGADGAPIVRVPASVADLSIQPDMCKRPDWRAGGRALSADALDALETRAFEAWKERLYALYGADALNHFEHNLEVWRQLWRVIERSDVVLLLADARCPALHFHESLWRHVMRDLGKACVLCLTKADLVTAAQAAAWVQFFEERYPGLRVVHFASSPKFTRVRGTRVVTADPLGAGSARRVLRAISDCAVTRGGAQVPAAPFVEAALAALPSAADSAQASSGGGGAAEEGSDEQSAQEGSDEGEGDSAHQHKHDTDDSSAATGARGEEGGGDDHHDDREAPYIVVGVLGDPNMGKSSLLNTLLGRRRVSTSATPGHTKHLQTMHVTKDLVLCDCPGVVHPQVGVPRALQVIFGLYPIAQVREPFTHVRFIAEHCWPPLPAAFGLLHVARQHREDLEYVSGRAIDPHRMADMQWSPFALCYCLAIREGFMTKGRGGRPDVFRAANKVLRDALTGRGGVLLSFWPPAEAGAAHALSAAAAAALPPDAPFLADGAEGDLSAAAAAVPPWRAAAASRGGGGGGGGGGGSSSGSESDRSVERGGGGGGGGGVATAFAALGMGSSSSDSGSSDSDSDAAGSDSGGSS